MRAWLGCGLVAGLMAASGCQAPPDRALAQADAHAARGDFEGAQRALRVALRRLERTPQGALPHEGPSAELADTLLVRLGELNAGPLVDVPQAVHDFSRVAEHQPHSRHALRALRTLADLYRDRLHQPEHAVTMLRAAAHELGSRTEGAQVREELWMTLMAMGNYAAAREEAAGIVERWPQQAEATRARLTMGRADFMEGLFKRAAETLEALIDGTKEPTVQALAMVEAGNCHQELGDVARALTFYYAALGHHPNAAMVQDKIARVRERIYHMAPKNGILNASRPSRHIAAWLPRPTPQELGVGAPILDVPHRAPAR